MVFILQVIANLFCLLKILIHFIEINGLLLRFRNKVEIEFENKNCNPGRRWSRRVKLKTEMQELATRRESFNLLVGFPPTQKLKSFGPGIL